MVPEINSVAVRFNRRNKMIRLVAWIVTSLYAPLPVAAGQLCYTGSAAQMFGGCRYVASRQECEAYRSAAPPFEANNSYCTGFVEGSQEPTVYSSPKVPNSTLIKYKLWLQSEREGDKLFATGNCVKAAESFRTALGAIHFSMATYGTDVAALRRSLRSKLDKATACSQPQRDRATAEKPPATPLRVGAVQEVLGEVWITGNNGVRQRATIGSSVDLPAKIETGSTGRIRIKLPDETSVLIAANSVLSIDEFFFDREKTLEDATYELIKGSFRFVGGLLLPRNSMIRFKFPGGTYGGIRGTEFIAEVHNGGITMITMIAGTMGFNLSKAPSGSFAALMDTRINVNAGHRIVVQPDGRTFRLLEVNKDNIEKDWRKRYGTSATATRRR